MKCRAHILLLCLFVSLFFNYSKGQNTKENYISIDHSEGLIFTDIQINGEPLRALIDFGDPHVLMLSYSIAMEKELDLTKTTEKAHYINGKSYDLYDGHVEKLKVGKWEMENVSFACSPGEIEDINKNISIHFDAVLGWSYFSQFNVTIDYHQSELCLSKANLNVSEFDFSSSFTEKNGYLEMEMEVDGEIKNFILDTGSPINLIDKSILSNRKIHTAINGNNVNIKLYSTDLSLLKQMNIYGMLGTDFFKMFIISIDPFNETILFQKSPYSASNDEAN